MNINADSPLRNISEENLEHLYINSDMASSVWNTIDFYSPNPLNSNVPIIDWLEYICNYKHRYKKLYENSLEKIFTILMEV